MIDMRKLRMLVALDRLGTIAAVGEELHLTAPGVSMQLRSLERELGVALTERQGRRLALTPAGRVLASHGRNLLDRLSLAELEVDALRRGATGSYRIDAFPSAARTFVTSAWQELRGESGDLSLSLTTPEPEAALDRLAAGETDLAVVHSYSNVPRSTQSGIDHVPLVDEPVWLAIRADDRRAAPVVDIADLAEHDWVVPTRELTCFQMIDRACGVAGFRPRVAAESADFAVQLELVAAGIGTALVPELTVARVPDGVLLARTAAPVTRRIVAARRSAMQGDPGLERVTAALAGHARAAVRDPVEG